MIYLVVTESCEHCKIGYSNNPKRRFSQIQTHNREKLHLSGVIDGGLEREAEIHKMFAHENIGGEWFNLTIEMIDYFSDMYGISLDKTNPKKHIKVGVTIDGSSFGFLQFRATKYGHSAQSFIRKLINDFKELKGDDFINWLAEFEAEQKQKSLAKSM